MGKSRNNWLVRLVSLSLIVMLLLSSNVYAMNTVGEEQQDNSLNVENSSALNETDIIYMVLTDRFYDGDL